MGTKGGAPFGLACTNWQHQGNCSPTMAPPFRISKTKSLSLRRVKNSIGKRKPTRTQRFDESSGLVYEEVIMAASMESVPCKWSSLRT